tara:strand:- start:342 stop:626 length:285 start_codon:yes stop_codon:yes gene_type:complete
MSFIKHERYRVMWVNKAFFPEIAEMNSDGFHSEKDAQEYADDLKKSFPKEEYYVEQYSFKEYVNDNNGGISGGIDGYEDMYPDYEYESGDYGWN